MRWHYLLPLALVPLLMGQSWLIFGGGDGNNRVTEITTSDDPDVVANAAPPGATIRFAAGVHTLSAAITAKDGQTFEGAGMEATILTGRRNLTTGTVTWTPDGGDWRTSSTEKAYTPDGAEACEAAFPECRQPDDLFYVVDGTVTPKLRVSAVGSVAPGTWFFDEAADTVWVGDDPISDAVGSDDPPSIYLSTGGPAITVNGVDNVTIRNLAVEMFAVGVVDGGAIRVIGGAEGARIESVRASWNHGRGIDCGSAVGLNIINSIASDNGQMGLVGCFLGFDLFVTRSEFNRNNYAGYSNDYASGGIKTGGGTGSRIVYNEASYNKNDAPGIWLDTNEAQTIVEHNRVIGNDTWGIKSEVSCNSKIGYNHVEGNGWEGILIDTSNTTDVYRNTVIANSRAITGGRQGGIDVWENDARVGTNFTATSGVATCSDSASWTGVTNVLVRENRLVWVADSPDVAIDPINLVHISNLETGDVDFVGNCYDRTSVGTVNNVWRIGNFDGGGAGLPGNQTFAQWSGAPYNFDNAAPSLEVSAAEGDCAVWTAP